MGRVGLMFLLVGVTVCYSMSLPSNSVESRVTSMLEADTPELVEMDEQVSR